MKNNILITGAAGFIGTNFIYHWLKNNPEDNIIGLDALTYAGVEKNLDLAKKSSNFKFIKCNINDNEQLPEIFNINCINKVVHFAAESHVDRSIQDPELFLKTNILGTFNLLNIAKKFWKENKIQDHHFHHISTDEVYGDLSLNDATFREKNQYLPNSPYAASKASSDHIVRAFNKTYSIKTTISNCSNNYGPFQFPEKLIPVIILNILDQKEIPIYGDGLNIRDWLHVSDHCNAIELIIKNGSDGETYNIGTNNEVTNIDLVNKICEIIDNQKIGIENSKKLISYVNDRLGHDRRYAINSSKIKKDLGFKAIKTFDESLEDTVKWYLDNKKWYTDIIK